jgi:hypothetical protein
LQEIFNLSQEEQERLLKRLTHHALCKMKPLTWRGASIKRGGSVPGGHEPYDFAVDSFSKALDGSRKWNREKHPTLEGFLLSIVDSDINHLAESLDNSHGRRIAPTKTPVEVDEAERVEGREVNPVFAVVNKEAHEHFLATAMKLLEGDNFLIQLLDCMEAEITEPSEIAEMLDISVDGVNNGKKRLRHKLDTLFSPRRKDRP